MDMELKKAVKRPTYTLDNVELIDLPQINSFLASVAHVLNQSYGPDYSNTMILNGPSLQVVHDGYTILRHLGTLHPFCKHLLDILSSISGRLNITVGDGTSTSAILAIILADRAINRVSSTDISPKEWSKHFSSIISTLVKSLETSSPSNSPLSLDTITNLCLTAMGRTTNDTLTPLESGMVRHITDLFSTHTQYEYVDIRSNNMNKIKTYHVDGFEFTGAHGDLMFESEFATQENEWLIENTNIILSPFETSNEFANFIMMLASNDDFLKACQYVKTRFTFVCPKYGKALFNVYHEALYKTFKTTLGYQPFSFLEYNKSIMETSEVLNDFIEFYEVPLAGAQELNRVCDSSDYRQALLDLSLKDSTIRGFSNTKNGINELFYITSNSLVDPQTKNDIINRLQSEITKDRELAKQIGSYSEILDIVKYEKRLANINGRKILSIGGSSNISTNYITKIAEDCVKVIISSIRRGVVLGQFCETKKLLLDLIHRSKLDNSIPQAYLDAMEDLLISINDTNRLAVTSYPTDPLCENVEPIEIHSGEKCMSIITSREHDIEILRGLDDFIHALMTTSFVVSDYILPDSRGILEEL